MPTATIVPIDVSVMLSILTGGLLPWLIARLQSWEASPGYRSGFAFLACVLVGGLTTILSRSTLGTWGADLGENAYLVVYNTALVVLTAWTTYARLWVNVGAFQSINTDRAGIGKPAGVTP